MRRTVIDVYVRHTVPYRHPHASHCTICASTPATDYEPIQRSTSITVYKQPHLATIHSSALSSLRKVIITESARNKLSSSHHALNSLLFATDGYPTATEDPAEIEETARTGAVGGGDARSGRERRDWIPLAGDPLSQHLRRTRVMSSVRNRCSGRAAAFSAQRSTFAQNSEYLVVLGW